MPRVRIFLMLAAATLIFTSVAFTQKTGTGSHVPFAITGSVVGEDDNRPIPTAKLQLSTRAGQFVTSTLTDRDGKFSFINISQGDYEVTATANGYDSAQQEVLLFSFNVPEIRISLRKSTSQNDAAPPGTNVVSSRELMLTPKAQEALHKGMERLYEKKDPAGSISYFQKVLSLSPAFYEAYYHEGMAYTYVRKNADAEAAFRRAIAESQEKYPDPYFGLGALLSDQGRFAESEKFVRQGLALQRGAWRGDFELARALLGLERPKDAEASALEARTENPKFSALYIILANIHLQLRNDPAVLEDLDSYLKLDPNGPFAAQARDLKARTEKVLSKNTPPPAAHPNQE